MARMTKRVLTDELWQQNERHLPEYKPSLKSVRLRASNRESLEGILYFYAWRRELDRRDGVAANGGAARALVPVTAVAAGPRAVEVRCPSGHVVTVPGVDGDTLR